MTEHSTSIYLWPSSVLNTFVKRTPGVYSKKDENKVISEWPPELPNTTGWAFYDQPMSVRLVWNGSAVITNDVTYRVRVPIYVSFFKAQIGNIPDYENELRPAFLQFFALLCCCLFGFNVAFNIFFSHITTVSGCDRELIALFYSAASMKYHAPDTWHDTTLSHIILTLGRPVLALPRKTECQARIS